LGEGNFFSFNSSSFFPSLTHPPQITRASGDWAEGWHGRLMDMFSLKRLGSSFSMLGHGRGGASHDLSTSTNRKQICMEDWGDRCWSGAVMAIGGTLVPPPPVASSCSMTGSPSPSAFSSIIWECYSPLA
jgi:hypothetical protein